MPKARRRIHRLWFIVLLALCSLVSSACGTEEEAEAPDATPDDDGCDAGDDNCVCIFFDDPYGGASDCINGRTEDGVDCFCRVCGDGVCRGFEDEDICPADCDFPNLITLTDATVVLSGNSPGALIDAVELFKPEFNESFFATEVRGHDDPCTIKDTVPRADSNIACDTLAMLDAPDVVGDGVCFNGGEPDHSRFTALNRGFVTLRFNASIRHGDQIRVYTLSPAECGTDYNGPTYDPADLQVSLTWRGEDDRVMIPITLDASIHLYEVPPLQNP